MIIGFSASAQPSVPIGKHITVSLPENAKKYTDTAFNNTIARNLDSTPEQVARLLTLYKLDDLVFTFHEINDISQEDYLEKVTSKTVSKKPASNAGSQTKIQKDSKGNTYVRNTSVFGREFKRNYVEIIYLNSKKNTGLSLRISCDLANKDKYHRLIEDVISSVEIN